MAEIQINRQRVIGPGVVTKGDEFQKDKDILRLEVKGSVPYSIFQNIEYMVGTGQTTPGKKTV